MTARCGKVLWEVVLSPMLPTVLLAPSLALITQPRFFHAVVVNRRPSTVPRMLEVAAVPGYAPVATAVSAVLEGARDQGVLDADAVASLSEPITAAVVLLAIVSIVGVVAKLVVERLVVPLLCGGSGGQATVDLDRFTRGRQLGKGSYGAVYEARRDNEDEASVVIKETNLGKDENTAEFAEAELFINQKLRLCGQSGCCATFLGYAYQRGSLSLVFKKEGYATLEDALGKGFPLNVEDIIGGGQGDDEKRSATVIRRISKQVFTNLAGIHSWSVVHRDVKGANFIISERDRKVKLVDFGVATDLATGTNYRADLQPFDPCFCPPEAPPLDRGGGGGIKLSAGGAFDVFSAGLLVIQMCFPNTRSRDGIKRFKSALEDYDYDLKVWRESLEGDKAYQPGFELLDKYGGWPMLQGCLRANPGSRISAAKAAASGFCA